MHKVKVFIPEKAAHPHRLGPLEWQHHNTTVAVLKDCGNRLLIRGVNHGPREYDFIPKAWVQECKNSHE